ncbi:hypothetical protein Rumeso_04739 [Rubellimicrobium mesophilum DSM 19309]|uniref:DNA-binding protein n=1 Tax=Rubellimicrobium mesophilum DSM 19309 TaxID=442562 RepID=A0A017HHK8_9RHOB|nr:AlpA family phage regulatory protein [Rubellimicrobium mesophilum]EYD73618.1 hypothetical protein Rumeso_04739 [Rubellimicrobium mesophilum DSM 19309]
MLIEVDPGRFYKKREVKQMLAQSDANLDRLVKKGLVPAPFRIGERDKVWSGKALIEWMGTLSK